MEQDLVRFSRAGDAFHYRWAARRCLKLLAPGSGVAAIYIEGSKESKLHGECSIDLSEYLEDGGIRYFQLKHTTTQEGTPFQFSHLKDTLQRFMARFAEAQEADVEFHFVSNRPVSKQIKEAIAKIADGRGSETTYLKKIRKITSLDSEGTENFCKRLNICDTEGDFRQQKHHLRVESAPYFTSSAESIELDSLIALVSERALPLPAGEEPSAITKEDVLSQLQISSEKILFPAAPIFDRIQRPQKREFQEDLEHRILRNDHPLIIRAPGGVGKTVVAQQLAENLHHPHKAVVYDCFGNGSYRSPSEPRHPARVGLVQIANELARDGLCSPLIPRYHDRDSLLFSAFKDRLTQAITTLRQSESTARLMLIIDAADNSQMAAEEKNEDSFAKLLFREDLPDGCKLVVFSRPGERRVGLLEPPASCDYYDLPCFTPAESLTLQAEALAGPAHLLIQRTAAEICLKILFKYPSLNTQEQVGVLTAIRHSPYALEASEKREAFKDAPWESPKTPEKKLDHYFHNDFGWYWFPQLRSLFGVAQHHIEYLAKFFIETSMGKPQESEFVWLRDPRSSSQSNYRSRSQNFQHSHGIYPSADTLDFYCEYHSFLHAAGRLLETTPVIKDDSGWAPEKDPLSSWLQRHLLTLEDGSWLCERRDPAPRHRRKWISGHLDEGWKYSVAEEEFDEILHNSMARENWVVLHGDWTDCNNGSVEVLRVKSALVEPATSDALGRFLMCQESPYDFAFPHCPDDESAVDDPPFVLRGIVLESAEDSIGLSAFDPYAGNLPYPPLEVARDYADLLDITPDSDGRIWRRSDSEHPVMTSEIWNQEGDETQKIYPSGRRIGVEQSLLSELCRKMKMDLIFCVEVHRYHEHDSREYFKEGTEGKKRSSHFRIFILSADGTIRKP